MKRIIQSCDSCKKNKENVITKRLQRRFVKLCPECLESMKWTFKCLELGTDWFIKKFGKTYKRLSKYSVTPINSIS